jgi:hypothetical protein
MCYNRNNPREEFRMKDPLRHLPFLLVLFLLVFVGATDLAIGADYRVLVTLLAPALWVGLYLLGAASDDEASPGRKGSHVPEPH